MSFADQLYVFIYSMQGLAILFVVGWICIALLWIQSNQNDKREKEETEE